MHCPCDTGMAAAVINRIVYHGQIVRFRNELYRNSHSLMRWPKKRAIIPSAGDGIHFERRWCSD